MAEDEETFDIYGDDDDSSTSPSSPSQSGPKKRLRRERSSSAPPMMSPKDEDDDGASTPRQKKMKEDEGRSDTTVVDEDEDPFREYEKHVCLSVSPSCTYILSFILPFVVWLRDHVFSTCMETDASSIVILRLLLLPLRLGSGLLWRGRCRRLLLFLRPSLQLRCMFLNCIGGPATKRSAAGPVKSALKGISRTSPSPSIK
jgi:hypothetical protein